MLDVYVFDGMIWITEESADAVEYPSQSVRICSKQEYQELMSALVHPAIIMGWIGSGGELVCTIPIEEK